MNPEEDTRNVLGKYRGKSVDEIKKDLDAHRIELQVAIENLERDFNMGTIVRTANAFNVRAVHIIGRKQWNRRGAMVTDAYMNIVYHASAASFLDAMHADDMTVIAMDIVDGAHDLSKSDLPARAVLVFGSEAHGLSSELMTGSDAVVQIEQFGSTRSVNVGVAAGIAMYEWVRRHVLTH